MAISIISKQSLTKSLKTTRWQRPALCLVSPPWPQPQYRQQQQRQHQHQHQHYSTQNLISLQRFRLHPTVLNSIQFFSTTTTTSNHNDNKPFHTSVDYTGPLGDLISRLKMVSITGCFLSLCVMPALVFLKNGDLPNAQQATMGTIATIGATGSTGALHFVFGSYVLDMKSISTSENDKVMLQATTRSVLGFKVNTHVFDPTTDISKYEGNRPFANFCANGEPLFVHPDKLDQQTRDWLLPHLAVQTATEPLPNDKDSEGLVKTKKKNDDDDELF